MISIDKKYMSLAIELALKGRGATSPNPMVGCVIVKGNKVVGKGYHKKAGTPHAEVNAIKDAGVKAKSSTLFVNLEPCAHFGKTPPCVDAIIKAGISKVVVGMKDVNPLVSGKGILKLKRAGIKVVTNILKKECEAINLPYLHQMKTGRPLVTAKVALTWDGKMAAGDGTSKWISSKAARLLAHQLRAEADAIMVGAETVRKDNPKLNVRLNGKPAYKKIIVVGTESKIPRLSNIFKNKNDILFLGNNAVRGTQYARRLVSWKKELTNLRNSGINSILVEGGGTLLSSMLNANVIDKLVLVVAPKLLGGLGKDLFPQLKIPNIKKALEIKNIKISQLGDEVILEGKPYVHRNN